MTGSKKGWKKRAERKRLRRAEHDVVRNGQRLRGVVRGIGWRTPKPQPPLLDEVEERAPGPCTFEGRCACKRGTQP